MAAGRLFIGAVMWSSGDAHAHAGSNRGRTAANRPNTSVGKEISNLLGSWGSGCQPDRCCRRTPSKGDTGIRHRLRTRGYDLRIRHNHANPPRFERRPFIYKCFEQVLQSNSPDVARNRERLPAFTRSSENKEIEQGAASNQTASLATNGQECVVFSRRLLLWKCFNRNRRTNAVCWWAGTAEVTGLCVTAA